MWILIGDIDNIRRYLYIDFIAATLCVFNSNPMYGRAIALSYSKQIHHIPPESDEILLTPRSIRFKNKKKNVSFEPSFHYEIYFTPSRHYIAPFSIVDCFFTLVGWIANSTILQFVTQIVKWATCTVLPKNVLQFWCFLGGRCSFSKRIRYTQSTSIDLLLRENCEKCKEKNNLTHCLR